METNFNNEISNMITNVKKEIEDHIKMRDFYEKECNYIKAHTQAISLSECKHKLTQFEYLAALYRIDSINNKQ